MAFKVVDQWEDIETETKNTSFSDKISDFLSSFPTAASRVASVPLGAAATRIGGFTGDIIEAPSDLTKFIYSFLGKEPPEFTEGPVEFRLNEEGQPRAPFLTTEEIRENNPLYKAYSKPENVAEEFGLHAPADIAATLATGGIKNPKALALGAGLGSTARGVSQATGIPAIPAAILEGAATGFGAIAGTPKRSIEGASKEGKRLTEIAQREGVTAAPASIQAAGRKGASRVLRTIGKAGEEVRDRAVKFGKQIENAYHDVLGEIYEPYKTERNLKVLRKQANELFEPIKNLSKQSNKKIQTGSLIDLIDDQIAEIRKSKSLTPGQKEAISILENTSKRIVNEGLNLEEAVETFRSYNKHIGWDQLTKNDKHLRNVKEALREEILKEGKKVEGFNDAFNVSNQAWTELSSLAEAGELLGKSFDQYGNFNIENFHKSLNNAENATVLKEVLGESNFNRLKEIGDLAKEGHKNFEAVGANLSEGSKAIHKEVGLLTGLTDLGSFGAKPLARNLAARILTSPNLQKNYIGYLRALRDNSPKLTAYYLRKIQDDLKEKESKQEKEKTFTVIK